MFQSESIPMLPRHETPTAHNHKTAAPAHTTDIASTKCPEAMTECRSNPPNSNRITQRSEPSNPLFAITKPLFTPSDPRSGTLEPTKAAALDRLKQSENMKSSAGNRRTWECDENKDSHPIFEPENDRNEPEKTPNEPVPGANEPGNPSHPEIQLKSDHTQRYNHAMKLIPATFLTLMLTATANAAEPARFADLTDQTTAHNFRATALYLDDSGDPFGARFVHEKTGFTLDLIQVQSVPQAFTWVNSFPVSDKGEPHTQEHLLVGKGNVGRALAASESMTLSLSSAFTMQWRT